MDMMPTPSALVSLSEWPPFVQGLDDIEFVHLERTGFGSRSFDIVIIPKDYKKIEKIEAIDMKQLDAVKQWLKYVL
jgi:nucleosome binding factor SPN SPT16 subunit